MAVALDSDVIVGFLDEGDALHAAADMAIRDLAAKERIVASVITYAEVLTGARIGHHAVKDVAGFFANLISRIAPVDVEIADRASELRAKTRALRMPDALIVATAELDPEVNLLLTGDGDIATLRGLRCDVQLLSASG